jgi:hypothetical protein
MSSNIYEIKYILNKVIPLKHLGKHISKKIVLSYSDSSNENSFNDNSPKQNSRKEFIDKVVTLLNSNNESIEDFKKRIIDILRNYDLEELCSTGQRPDITTASQEFDEFIERRRQANSKKLTAKHILN